MAVVDPVIVVPAVIATYLRDEYPLPHELIWSVMTREYERATPHPENSRFDAILPARIMPDQIFEAVYLELIRDLRHDLRSREDQPVPVYAFPYDWRQPLVRTQMSLATFIEETIARTKLMRHYANSDWINDPKVTLIGHSMGGLLIAGYLSKKQPTARVRKVVTIAAPFRGSIEAIKKVVTGTGSTREREAARLTPSLYHLLPSFSDGVRIDGSLGRSIFDSGVWQESVLGTIREALRVYGTCKRSELASRTKSILDELLGTARAHRASIESLKLSDVGLTEDDWLCLVGVDSDTRVKAHVENVAGKPTFRFSDSDVMNEWNSLDPGQRRFTGDGTVPLEGAIPPFLPAEKVVCVSRHDFGGLELKDKLSNYLIGLHGIMPNMNVLHQTIVHFLTGTPDKYDTTFGRRLPGVENWKPPLPLAERG